MAGNPAVRLLDAAAAVLDRVPAAVVESMLAEHSRTAARIESICSG